MRAGSKSPSKPIAKGAGKQFGGGGGKTPFVKTAKAATASMQGGKPQSEAPQKSIARKDARKNTFKAGGKNVF